jgi:head-tail adaptor
MNPGELKDRIKVLTLSSAGNTYAWEAEASIWAKVERQSGTNIFSSAGLGAKSIKFTIRKRNITLHNAFRWKDKHCFLTDIVEINRMYYEVTAALVEPKTCTVERTGAPTLDGLNRPIYGEPTILTFPACLTEKYIRHTQDNPMSTIEAQYVLVTPKVITLEEGELVTVENTPYEILVMHTLDEYKNEYEVSARRDA